MLWKRSLWLWRNAVTKTVGTGDNSGTVMRLNSRINEGKGKQVKSNNQGPGVTRKWQGRHEWSWTDTRVSQVKTKQTEHEAKNWQTGHTKIEMALFADRPVLLGYTGSVIHRKQLKLSHTSSVHEQSQPILSVMISLAQEKFLLLIRTPQTTDSSNWSSQSLNTKLHSLPCQKSTKHVFI